MMMRRLGSVIFLLFGAALPLFSLEVPPPTGRINDVAGILSASARSDLESYLAGVERASGAQIALLTIPSLGDEVLESYSLRVAETWALGDADDDNGALLLVAMAERKVRIEVGYGLEAELTDAMSGFIIREVIVPEFKKGNFDGGIAAGLQVMGGVATGDAPIPPERIEKADRGNLPNPVFIFIFLLVFAFSRVGGYRRYRRRGMSPARALFLGMFLGGRHRGGGSSSFGGGGFSGGGGGFGGGGASGGW